MAPFGPTLDHHHRGHLGHLPIAANLIVVVHNPTTI
jgi:hypothetical protein